MKKRLLFSLIVITNLFLVAGCGSPKEEGKENLISEGVINYTAEVVDMSNSMADMAPSKMIVKFKNNKSSAGMSAGMGALTMSFIADPEAKTLTQLVWFLGKKYSLIQNSTDIQKENELFNIEIIPTNQTKVIAGYNCKKAKVHYKGGDPNDYDIYYTTEINIENSNFANPYYKIDGVLMEYRIKKFGLELQFTATSVTKEPVEDTNFEIPPEYKAITAQEMTDLFIELQ
ncbi:MAG: hypothetical protein V4608_09025 [Bacteroidota bacterium]